MFFKKVFSPKVPPNLPKVGLWRVPNGLWPLRQPLRQPHTRHQLFLHSHIPSHTLQDPQNCVRVCFEWLKMGPDGVFPHKNGKNHILKRRRGYQPITAPGGAVIGQSDNRAGWRGYRAISRGAQSGYKLKSVRGVEFQAEIR